MSLFGLTCRRRIYKSFLALVLLCTACAKEAPVSRLQFFSRQYIQQLPAEFKGGHIYFAQILQAYDSLNDKQKGTALEQFLLEDNLAESEKAEASYMLARLYQQFLNAKEALALFQIARTYDPLKTPSLWHISELAAICGDEKLVREILNILLTEEKESSSVAAAEYGLAQSYLRASEADKAIALFNKIRINFPKTDYALGAGYYLGTLAYTQLEKFEKDGQFVSSTQMANSLKAIRNYYFGYLKASPSGRFAQDILDKLQILNLKHHLSWTNNELAIIANGHFSSRRYALALEYWQKAGVDKYPLEIAKCFLKLKQVESAQQKLLRAMWLYPHDGRSIEIANNISEYLSKQNALKLWQQLHNPKFCHQDAVLWNLAIRSPKSDAIHFYQEILARYTNSSYGPEAQWRLFWNNFKETKSPVILIRLCSSAANKYSSSRLAPRFLYWAGKISESTGDKARAIAFYQQTIRLYSRDYYGQRASMRLAVIEHGGRDDYFNPRLIQPQAGYWDWPLPQQAMAGLKKTNQITTYELIYLKQYNEVLEQKNKLKPVIVSWLYGKTGEAWTAINLSARYLQKYRPTSPENISFLQYSYPLPYNQLVASYCQNTSVDPLLVHALIRQESRYDPHAISQVGALGLCQLMPGTANGIAKNIGSGITNNDQLLDPALNLRLGIMYLASTLNIFHDDKLLAIASYNAGANAVKNQLGNEQDRLTGDPDIFVEDFPYRETRDYIRKVFSSYWSYRQIYGY